MREKMRRRVNEMLAKKVVLLGRHDCAEDFYKKYRDRLNICGMVPHQVTRETESWGGIYTLAEPPENVTALDCPEISLSEIARDSEAYTCIICQRGMGDNELENWLAWSGLEYMHHYMPSCIADAVLCGRKVVFMHGFYCFVRDLLLLMQTQPDVLSKYCFYIYPFDENASVKYRSTMNIMLLLADYYVCNKDATGNLRYTDDEIPPEVKRISFPCLNFGGIYPQIDYRHYKYTNPFYLKITGRPDLGFKFGDTILNRLILDGRSDDEILEYIHSAAVFPVGRIRQHFDRELRCAELYEYDCDIKLTPYIKAYYQKDRITNCNDHWCEKLLTAVGEQILNAVGYDTSLLSDDFWNFKNPHRYSEVPIYPAVGEALQMEWVNRDTVYHVRMAQGDLCMTFDEYVRRYCAYVRAVIALKNNE